MKRQNVLKITMVALMASIICILAPLSIPIPFSIVPISCATFAIYLTAGVLGAKLGTISVAIYILLGFVGLPVFAGWSAGAGVVIGPTGGYIFGYLLIAFFAGICMNKKNASTLRMAFGMVLGTIGCYTIGTLWLGMQLHLNVKEALMAGVIPYILGDVIKIILALLIIKPLRAQSYNRIMEM